MLNRQLKIQAGLGHQTAAEAGTFAVLACKGIKTAVKTLHHTILVAGLMAIGTLGVMFVRPEFADQLKALSPYAADRDIELVEVVDAAPAKMTNVAQANNKSEPVKQLSKTPAVLMLNEQDLNFVGDASQQERVTSWLSKRYRVARDATNMLVSASYLTARELKLDPLLILSVIAIESRFNPFAESPVGAQGLMQVMSKVHRDKFQDHGGVKAALNPIANIKVGSSILKEYVRRGGSVEAGLKLYVGAGAMETDLGYGAKVLAEYNRLKDVAMGKKVSIFSTSASAPQKNRQEENKEGVVSLKISAPVDQEVRQDEETDKVAAL